MSCREKSLRPLSKLEWGREVSSNKQAIHDSY